MKKTPLIILTISLLAGAADAMTGISLLLAPELTLSLMGVQVDAASLVFIRYIGAFVFSVGGSYLAGLLPVWRKADWTALRTVWLVTAWVRLVVCLFTTYSILSGSLAAAWMSVPLTDGLLALLQGGWIAFGPWPSGKGPEAS